MVVDVKIVKKKQIHERKGGKKEDRREDLRTG